MQQLAAYFHLEAQLSRQLGVVWRLSGLDEVAVDCVLRPVEQMQVSHRSRSSSGPSPGRFAQNTSTGEPDASEVLCGYTIGGWCGQTGC
jgi:hypothetical protein